MQVNHVATMQLESIQANAPIREAAEKMRRANVGLLLVAKGKELVGVVTDRDIVTRSVAAGDGVGSGTTARIMSHPVVCIEGHDELANAVKLMSEKGVRRLVVLNDHLVPVGVLSIDDVAFSTHGNTMAAEVLEDLAHGTQSAAIFRNGQA